MPKRTDIKSILLIGSGPIVIGQACEFDYSGAQACKALREEGYKVILVNSNPATIMTDPEMADVTYIEPLTVEILEMIIDKERPDALLPTMGGQTALNLAVKTPEDDVERCGYSGAGDQANRFHPLNPFGRLAWTAQPSLRHSHGAAMPLFPPKGWCPLFDEGTYCLFVILGLGGLLNNLRRPS